MASCCGPASPLSLRPPPFLVCLSVVFCEVVRLFFAYSGHDRSFPFSLLPRPPPPLREVVGLAMCPVLDLSLCPYGGY